MTAILQNVLPDLLRPFNAATEELRTEIMGVVRNSFASFSNSSPSYDTGITYSQRISSRLEAVEQEHGISLNELHSPLVCDASYALVSLLDSLCQRQLSSVNDSLNEALALELQSFVSELAGVSSPRSSNAVLSPRSASLEVSTKPLEVDAELLRLSTPAAVNATPEHAKKHHARSKSEGSPLKSTPKSLEHVQQQPLLLQQQQSVPSAVEGIVSPIRARTKVVKRVVRRRPKGPTEDTARRDSSTAAPVTIMTTVEPAVPDSVLRPRSSTDAGKGK